jgi:hypothetical protein
LSLFLSTLFCFLLLFHMQGRWWSMSNITVPSNTMTECFHLSFVILIKSHHLVQERKRAGLIHQIG